MWDHQYYTPGCDEMAAAAAAHKYGDFTSNKIFYNRRALQHINILLNNKYKNMFIKDTESILFNSVYDLFWRLTWNSFLMD